MTIDQLLQMPIGQKTGGFELTIKKHPSKKVEIGKGKWVQPVVFIDETGEIYAEIFMTKIVTLQKQWKIHITVGEIQNHSEQGKKLYVHQWVMPTMSLDEYLANKNDFEQEMKYGEPINIVRGKCKMHVVCAYIRGRKSPFGAPTETLKKYMNEWVDFILEDITKESHD